MARKTLDPSQVIRCDILIDRQLNPELFDAVAKITGARSRASFVRNCAEKYLVMPKGQQLMQANGVAFHIPSGNPHNTDVILSSGAVESHRNPPPEQRRPPQPNSNHAGQKSAAGETGVPDGILAGSNVPLSTPSPVRHKRAGSAALASMLSNATPGLS